MRSSLLILCLTSLLSCRESRETKPIPDPTSPSEVPSIGDADAGDPPTPRVESDTPDDSQPGTSLEGEDEEKTASREPLPPLPPTAELEEEAQARAEGRIPLDEEWVRPSREDLGEEEVLDEREARALRREEARLKDEERRSYRSSSHARYRARDMGPRRANRKSLGPRAQRSSQRGKARQRGRK